MARQSRKFSISGYMHVIMRGNGKQILFEEPEDYQFYIAAMEKYSEQTNVEICAYCLMDNHVHMLIHDVDMNMPVFMKKIGVSYSGYYNKKYEKNGHLFQDRYLSETIDNEPYLLTVFRYILNNPAKAGLCKASEYKWSSFAAYANTASFVNTKAFEVMIGDKTQYNTFLGLQEDDKCMEFEKIKHDDKWAKEVMLNNHGIQNGTILKTVSKAQRDEIIRQLKKEGISTRQIARLTGLGRSVIQRA